MIQLRITLRKYKIEVIAQIFLCNLYFCLIACPSHAFAQNALPPTASAATPKLFIPQFFDPNRHRKKPDLTGIKVIHFLSAPDDPPFHFSLSDGTLAGFDIDLAQHICQVLEVACTIQMRRFDTQLDAINAQPGEALLSERQMNAHNRAEFDFTSPYYRTPAWFIALKSATLWAVTPQALSGRTIGVVTASAHEAFLAQFFEKTKRKAYPTTAALEAGLQRGEVDLAFGDGISFSFWLIGTQAKNCCQFIGGPFTDPDYFGQGVGIAVKKGNFSLRRALDYALEQISENGTYTDLYLKYFPLGFF